MRNRLTSRIWLKVFLGICLVLLGFLAYQQGAAPVVSAADRVEQAWLNVRFSDHYAFAADVVIETIPLPTAGNIGRFSKTDSLYLEGSNDLNNKTLEMALWGGGVSAADRAAAYQVRVRDGRTETRAADGEWQTSDSSAAAFAPDGDFLAFLDVATNVTLVDDPMAAGRDSDGLARYTFDLDGDAYAQKLGRITQEQMIRSDQIPPGASVQIPEHLAQIAGSGELWVDARGLPVRQKVTMAIPPADGDDYRTETVMDIRFSDYQGAGRQIAAIPWLQPLAARLARANLPSASESGLGLGLFSMFLIGTVVVARPGRRTRLVTTVAGLIAILITPTLQAHAFTAAAARLDVRKTEHAAVEQARSVEQTALDIRNALRAAGPYTPPAASPDAPPVGVWSPNPAAQTQTQYAASSTLDSDNDGLTDAAEALIGTSPLSNDSDFDAIPDQVEVTGFNYSGKTWYGNPLWADSNNDGRIDSEEWNTVAPDSDGDGAPDLYDFDDDGDGVPDDIDISPVVASKDNAGAAVTFSQANSLNLTIDGLQANRYTYVSLQLRPTNPDHLWYAFNVLNWPKDEKGNMQDWDGKTIFDLCKAAGGSNCQMTPDANGDLKLVPMLEVAVNDLSNLPRKPGGALDTQLLSNYNISVQPAGNGGYYLYAPLSLVEDKVTGAKVAFNAQLLYQTGASWQPQQVRLSWAVQALNEQYASPEAAEKALKAGNGTGNNQQTILHAYYDEFTLTGLNVREDHGVEMAIVYEDPATDPDVASDDALMHMMSGLDGSYLSNRDCDFVDNAGKCIGDGQRDITIPVIKARWDRLSNSGITDGQRWGIPANRLRVQTQAFAHEDEATMVGGGQVAPAILNAHFTGTTAAKPSLLFVRESRFRARNIDVRGVGAAVPGAITWSGRNVKIGLTDVTEMITGSYVLAPYRYVSATSSWARQTPQEYVQELERRYPLAGAPGVQVVTPGEQAAVIIVQTSGVQGNQTALSQNGTSGLSAALNGGGAIRLQGADVRDEDLRRIYTQALTAAGRAAPYLAATTMLNHTGLSQIEWNNLVTKFYGGQSISVDKYIELVVANKSIAQFRLAMGVAVITGVVLGVILTNIGGAQTGGEILLASMTAASSTIEAIATFKTIANNLRSLGDFAGSSVAAATLSFRYTLNSAVAKAAAVGAVIGIVATWALFFAAWGKGGLSVDSVAFNNLVAGAVAATLVIVLTFFLSLSVVGVIILAVFAVFDLIALIICKAGVKLACSLGITEAITKLITDWLYTGGVMIDTKADPSITNIEDAQMRLTNPERGLVVGNGVRFVVDLWTYVRHAAPEPGIVYHYPSFFTPEDLRSTTVRYALESAERKLPADLNQTGWADVVSYGWVEAEVPSPVVGWLVPTVKSKNLYHGARSDQLTSGVYAFTTAKINQTYPLYLNTGMALPRYDCWFQVCVHKAAKSSVSTDLGKSFVLDILPATLDEFVSWTELGPQTDRDGDGLGITVDPDPARWDADGDGAPDGRELRYGSNPRTVDADGDSLNDAQEIRYGTNPRQADTDGDGISDAEEVNGYLLILGDRSVHVTSDPLSRDTDDDGISDGAERRLNGIDATRYPFHPRVTNDSPARLYTTLSDLDRVLAVGASTTVTTTVYNGTVVENALMASGRFSSTLPSRLGGASQTKNFTLLPTTNTSIVQTGTATGGASIIAAIDAGLAADLVPVGSAPSGPADDIIFDSPVPVTIDNDPPDPPALTLGAFVQPGRTVIIGGTTSDPTSYVAQVDVKVGAGSFSPSAGVSPWAFPVDIPNTPTGSVPITVRAADAVNNTRSADYNLTIDGVSPVQTVGLNPGDVRQVRRNAAGEWTLSLSGVVTDALAGVASLTLQIGVNSTAVLTPTAIAPSGMWDFTYVFDESSFNADPRPTGVYSLTVTARDNALPDGNPATLVIPFTIDMTPPVVELLSHKDEMEITDGAVITGTAVDEHAAVASVEYAFVDASTAISTGLTLLHLPLNDLPETVLFNNQANDPTRIFCLDASCPTSGVNGADGTAAQFGGDDLLRSFETLDLPESGLTTSLWFKTTCANCGLFSAVQGVYPAVTEHDRDLFLADGKVCSSILVGAVREVRCTVAGSYADGQWHQAVHSLGAGGNALYLDGQLAVSSPTTASTFTTQDRALIGHAAASVPHFTGALDDVLIYDGALSADSVAALYRRWQPAALSGNTWSFTIPQGLEGYTQIDMRATDSAGNRIESRGDWPQFRGPVDTRFPSFDVSAAYRGSGSSAQTIYGAEVRDANLTTDNYDFTCPLANNQLRFETSAAQFAFTGLNSTQLSGIVAQCSRAGFQTSLVAATACDTFGHCGASVPPQSIAYIGTYENRIQPFGSLPNAIERANLSDPGERVRLLERPGRKIVDIAVDELHNKLYWAEITEGPGGQPAGVWRADLDGSNPQQVVSGLIAYAAEALQIALDPVGNKLYWTKGYQVWSANLDGTLPQAIYSIAPDSGYIGGALDLMAIGDVAVDAANGRLYLSERRLRNNLADYNAGIRFNGQHLPHTLIVTTDLNGQSPEFFAGVGPGCTYANYYDNIGYGVGAGQDPTLCLISGTDGFDVESLTVRDGTLYWSAINADKVGSGVYGRTPGQSAFTVAPLALPGNSGGLRVGPLPQLYVDDVSGGVFVQLPGEGVDGAGEIVRGETGGEFTRFTSFRDDTPAAPGNTRRSSSKLSAMAIVRTAPETQTDTDLAVGITSPALVIVDGAAARYDIALRNDAALAAEDTVLTLALPDGASYTASNAACAAGGATVTCDLDRFAPLTQQTVVISFTVATSTVRDLTATASVASSTADRTPANNSASHSGITAAPTLSALPGIPYVYYGDVTRLTRVPLFGDYTAEPLFMTPSISGDTLAADLVRNRLYIITNSADTLIAVNPDGTGRVELANTNPDTISTQGRNRVAVDETTGRVYWSQIKSYYLTTIKSANPDGTDLQTVIDDVRNQRGLLVDPIRRKLLWVGSDIWLRQELIFRSNLDGSGLEAVYAAPVGTQIRDLSLDPSAQMLYWLDPATENGTLFRADANGGTLTALLSDLGSNARGLIVRPEQNALFYVTYGELHRSELDGSNDQMLSNLNLRPYTGLALPASPTAFAPTNIVPPSGNLAFVIAAPFAAPPCVVNDGHEPNNSATEAVAITAGITTGALCTTDAAKPQDIDFYKITVPDGKQLNLTLSNLPADYGLYVQRAGLTVATSLNAGLTNETIALPNYEGDALYTVAVFSGAPVNNPGTYTLAASLSDAPPQTVFTNAQCLAVDPNDAAGAAGNHSQSQATPLTLGSPATGALCYQFDTDFYSFSVAAGQQLIFDLPVRPANYWLTVYRPDGSYFITLGPGYPHTYGHLVTADTTGVWAVAVGLANNAPTLSTYQLLVSDGTCSVNDGYEPNNAASQAATLGAPGRVNATLCAADDVDTYKFSATAGQRLTINYPANAAGATLRVLNPAGAEVGRVLPGSQGNFTLAVGGDYTLLATNPALAASDLAYMFQWLPDAPQTTPESQYLYYTNGLLGQLYRVALSADHTVEPLFLSPSPTTSGPAIAADSGRSLLYSYDPLYGGDGQIVRNNTLPFDGSGYAVVVAAPNPDGVSDPPVAVAVDEQVSRIYWVQPQGGSASLGSTIRSANGDGSSPMEIVGDGLSRTSLAVDSVRGLLYWLENGAIRRSNLDGSNNVEIRASVGHTLYDLVVDPFAQTLYWLDPTQTTIFRANADGSGVTAVVTGLSADARGVAVQPLQNALYYSTGGQMMQAALDGSNPAPLATLSGAYSGPSNLDANAFPLVSIQSPQSPLAIGSGAPIVSPCTLADGYEPNNDPGSATPLTVVATTEIYGALCRSALSDPADVADYYTVTLDNQKTLSVTLSELPANYRVIVQRPAGVNQLFSDNDGLADEFGVVSNTSGDPAAYTIIVTGYGFQNTQQYKLTLEVGDVPPPPNPDAAQCYAADSHDAPAPGGNGTLPSATPLGLGAAMVAALCYSDDVDMYGFDGLAGQTVTLDLPIRPADYSLTLYDPAAAVSTVISSTTTPSYGGSVTLTSSGRWTVAVSQPGLTPTTDQYHLLVSDQNCVASDANEPNNSPSFATVLNNGSRVRATLCNPGDVDLYTVSATAGQELTLNYPANATGAVARVVPAAGGADLGQVAAGSQGIFNIPADGDYHVVVENNALAGSAVPYLFELLVGSPVPPPSGSPYIYYSRVSDLIRTAVVTGTVEPILLPNTFTGGNVLASDSVRSKLYILDNFERIVRVDPDGRNAQVVVADTGPGVLRFTESLAVDERSGRIYWTQATFGVVSDILSGNGDGSDVQTVVTGVVADHGIAIDPVGGRLYWVQNTLHNNAIVDHIRRANLDGTGIETVYAAPEGRQIRELAVDAFAQMLYWRDPTQNRLLQVAADGSADAMTVVDAGDPHGFVVRPLLDELYFTTDSQLWSAARDGGSPVALARLDEAYNGVSNLDANVFYPTVITPPGSNLALAFSGPYAPSCATVDSYEPNDTLVTAAAITPGSLSAALCTDNLANVDDYDYYTLTVADGKQITATLTDLPQDYGLVLLAGGIGVGWGYNPGTADEVLNHVNRTGASVAYTILVLRNLAASTRLPYTLDVLVTDAPPPPPPPPPPPDACAPFDVYDQPGFAGNQTRETATGIALNTTITAALCYAGDKDFYAFDGTVGQSVKIDLPVRPADYLISIYNPDGQYAAGIFPGSFLNYGDRYTLNATGRWTIVIWASYLAPTTAQYELELSYNTACFGIDPYEPNNEQFSPHAIITPTLTLRTVLCETDDNDWYSFPLTVGDRIRVDPRVLADGMRITISPPGFGFGETSGPFEHMANTAGDFLLVVSPPAGNTTENLPYEIDIQITPPPPPTPTPNHWTCSTYASGDIPRTIEDFSTLASTVNVPVNGTVTHVGLRDITFDHGALWNISFGLAAPDGTQADLFAFEDYGFYVWCGGSNCRMSLDDDAIEGLTPPQFPNDGGTFRPSRSSFAPFEGKASNGTWTLFITDNGIGSGEGSTVPGDLFSWGLEVCVDNGAPPDPTATPTPTPTPIPDPQPGDGAPETAVAPPVIVPAPAPEACTPTADAYEDDDTYQTASLFDGGAGSSAGHGFDSPADPDWQEISLAAGLQYTLTAVTANPAQVVSLALYGTDGATPLGGAWAGQLTYEPAASGRYYVRAASGSGLSVSLCSSDYSLVLTSSNPNATPVTDPAGDPLPPDHAAPQLSAAVLEPADGTVRTDTQPIHFNIGLNAENGIASAALFANGASVGAFTPSPGDTDVTWPAVWSPPGGGVYTMTATITDTTALTATSSPSLLYIDLAGPAVSIVDETITIASLANDGSYRLRGAASDDTRVVKVEVRLAGGEWQEAALDGDAWSFTLAPLAQANPDGGILAVEARVTDKAGRTIVASATMLLDVTPPVAFDFTPSLIGPTVSAASVTSGEVISPSVVYRDLSVRLSWPAVSGATAIYAGWTTMITPTLASLTAYGPAAGFHDQMMPEGSAMYAHVVAVDANGNQQAVSRGPFYFDSEQTPDLIDDLVFVNWVDAGGKQIGQMTTPDRGVQKLFAGWNANTLRLRWQGLNLSSDGDLYLYLDRGSGGSSDLFDPNGAGQSGVLPFAADLVVRLSSEFTPTLYAYSGGAWVMDRELSAHSSGDLNDVLLPFADLGIISPAGATLTVLGIATEKGSLDVWATLPDKNLGQPWNQFIQFNSLGVGIVPNEGVWADAQIEVTVTADPSPAQLLGPGDAVSVTVTALNTGSATLPQMILDGDMTGGVALSNAPQVASSIAPSSTVALTLNGAVTANGTLALTLADSFHRPYALETLSYSVDASPPISVSVAVTAVMPYTNTVLGFAQDDSPLGLFELEIGGGGGTQTILCDVAGPSVGSVVCTWDAGNVTDGAAFTLRARAADIHGNVSGWSTPIPIVVDATPPELALSAAALAALSDGRLNATELGLSGTLIDTVAADSALLCTDAPNVPCISQGVLPDGSWTLSAPSLGDGVTTTLAFTGYDMAGNASQPLSETVLVDTVAPQFGAATLSQIAAVAAAMSPSDTTAWSGDGPSSQSANAVTLLATGTVTDGDGVAAVDLFVVKPDGSSAILPATLDGANWTATATFDQSGDYRTLVIAKDNAGNLAMIVPEAGSASLTVRLNLRTNWNLVAFPVALANSSPGTVFTSISGSYSLVYGFDACDISDPWEKYDPAAPVFANDLAAIQPGRAYWVRGSSASSLGVTGPPVAPLSISLCTGWNLIGYPSLASKPLPDALATLAGKYDLVYAYDAADAADPWKKYDPNAPPFANDLQTLGPGKGYWVRMTSAGTLTVNP